MKVTLIITCLMLCICSSAFTQALPYQIIAYFEGETIDPIDSNTIYSNIILEISNCDIENVKEIQIEINDVLSKNLISRTHLDVLEDERVTYMYNEGKLLINMGFFLSQTDYKVFIRIQNYQGMLGDLIEISL